MDSIETMRTELTNIQNQARTILAKTPTGQPVPSTDKAKVDALLAEGKALQTRLDGARRDLAITAEVERLTAGVTTSGSQGGRRGGLTLGQQFIDSETFEWIKKHRHSLPTGAWTSPASDLMAATLTGDPASGGELVIADSRPGILPSPTRPLVMADLIAPGTTDN